VTGIFYCINSTRVHITVLDFFNSYPAFSYIYRNNCDMSSTGKFAEIILPLPINQVFSYEIPDEINLPVHAGKRVIVQFGSRKLYTGIVRRIQNISPGVNELKPIMEVLDETPLVNEIQMKFWEWMADYYMCTPGEVYKAALPSGLKLESESRILPVKKRES